MLEIIDARAWLADQPVRSQTALAQGIGADRSASSAVQLR
jgi:hypothetical protein